MADERIEPTIPDRAQKIPAKLTQSCATVDIRIVNTDPEQWIGGRWQAISDDGWRSRIYSFRWRARLAGWFHR